MRLSFRPARLFLPLALLLLAACGEDSPKKHERSPEEVRAQLQQLIPARVRDRAEWAADIQSAFQSLQLPPTTANLCAVLAVIEQETGYQADPAVPGLGRIAREEIVRRAGRLHIPEIAVDGMLRIKAADGVAFGDKLARVRTERELSELYQGMVQKAPALARGWLTRANPVRTGGPMQVSIDYAERQVRERPYPYPLARDGVRQEVFTRRGGLYFGIAHLLKYPVEYNRHLYRFADFNAGHYASRNAAFQHAISLASGIPLVRDGDLLVHGDKQQIGNTENALRSLAPALGLDAERIRRDLERSQEADFSQTRLYEALYALAEQRQKKPLPRAMLPQITLESPKITRQLTTEWFANRVERRYRECEARAARL